MGHFKYAAMLAGILLIVSCATVQKDWEKAKTQNSVQSYRYFVHQHPASEYSDEARLRIDTLQWEDVNKSKYLHSYQIFIYSYPENRFVPEAKKKIEAIKWVEACKTNTATSYQYYMKEYPQSVYAPAAEKKYNELRWRGALEVNSADTYRSFIRDCPKSPNVSDANKKIDELSWQETLQADKIEAYENYIKQNPQGRYVKEAGRRIAGIREVESHLKTLKTPAQLEQLLNKYPDQSGMIIPKLEAAIKNEIMQGNIGNRFVIPETGNIVPDAAYAGSITLSLTGGTVMMHKEFPGDQIQISMQGTGFGPSMPLGDGSIHRYAGNFVLFKHYTFFGEGGPSNRLTFCLLKKKGFVYMRGKGRVILKDGRKIELGS